MFGDQFLPTEKQDQKFKEAITAKTNGVLATINYKAFHKTIGGDIMTVL